MLSSERKSGYLRAFRLSDGSSRRFARGTDVGPYVAASLIAEIQSMEQFTKANRLVAYVGLDLQVRQSGDSLNYTGHLTKHGSSYLRRSLFMAGSVARQYDPYFKSVYDKKRGEGKGYTTATLAVARKLLLVVRAVWLSGQPYDLARVSARGAEAVAELPP
jgi:transposase